MPDLGGRGRVLLTGQMVYLNYSPRTFRSGSALQTSGCRPRQAECRHGAALRAVLMHHARETHIIVKKN
eukprot:scaffold24399_cov83-Isochrysis_galbana.AAC.2